MSGEPSKPRKHRPVAGSAVKKEEGQTRGQAEKDPKGRKGQYTAAGDSALTKK